MDHFGVPVVTLEEFARLRPTLGTIVAASGGFDPIHPGHISLFQEAKKLGDTLVVVVNGDAFLRAKKGRPFLNLETRCQIVSAIRGVDFVVPFEIENDPSICGALEKLRPHIYAKSGQWTHINPPPELKVCEREGINIVYDVGAPKRWSSSEFLKNWEDYKKDII
ncbi:MAG: hypothetical protein UX74_C0035G0006 [Parcubacteria group bacterium GW2011_GWA2_47_10b]|nr:MAG: hypothetical protein UX74_C0035G0006 [Parcubacteria group bacterium GW2011_GWA2_47_10b]OGZ49340.1 MAG: hypothetical protein A3C83_03525 [Candidatus Ryanbacteria bacterium RIFCSPHIGHO2_02_FULL_47_25]OGZ52357.1 MAG: hypothetical protein A3A29_01575 [Candidatus Ryanbacteria bacterium RIFCSPLOWO2_01_FULL_47_79]